MVVVKNKHNNKNAVVVFAVLFLMMMLYTLMFTRISHAESKGGNGCCVTAEGCRLINNYKHDDGTWECDETKGNTFYPGKYCQEIEECQEGCCAVRTPKDVKCYDGLTKAECEEKKTLIKNKEGYRDVVAVHNPSYKGENCESFCNNLIPLGECSGYITRDLATKELVSLLVKYGWLEDDIEKYKASYEEPYSTLVKPVFKDVSPDSDYFYYIQKAFYDNIVKGYPDRTFKPKNKLTRAEMIVIMLRSAYLKLDPSGIISMKEKSSDELKKLLPDVKKSHWAYYYLAYAKEKGLIKGDAKTGNVRPDDYLKCKEFYWMLGNLEEFLKGFEEQMDYFSQYLKDMNKYGFPLLETPIDLNECGRFVNDTRRVRSEGDYIVFDVKKSDDNGGNINEELKVASLIAQGKKKDSIGLSKCHPFTGVGVGALPFYPFSIYFKDIIEFSSSTDSNKNIVIYVLDNNTIRSGFLWLKKKPVVLLFKCSYPGKGDCVIINSFDLEEYKGEIFHDIEFDGKRIFILTTKEGKGNCDSKEKLPFMYIYEPRKDKVNLLWKGYLPVGSDDCFSEKIMGAKPKFRIELEKDERGEFLLFTAYPYSKGDSASKLLHSIEAVPYHSLLKVYEVTDNNEIRIPEFGANSRYSKLLTERLGNDLKFVGVLNKNIFVTLSGTNLEFKKVEFVNSKSNTNLTVETVETNKGFDIKDIGLNHEHQIVFVLTDDRVIPYSKVSSDSYARTVQFIPIGRRFLNDLISDKDYFLKKMVLLGNKTLNQTREDVKRHLINFDPDTGDCVICSNAITETYYRRIKGLNFNAIPSISYNICIFNRLIEGRRDCNIYKVGDGRCYYGKCVPKLEPISWNYFNINLNIGKDKKLSEVCDEDKLCYNFKSDYVKNFVNKYRDARFRLESIGGETAILPVYINLEGIRTMLTLYNEIQEYNEYGFDEGSNTCKPCYIPVEINVSVYSPSGDESIDSLSFGACLPSKPGLMNKDKSDLTLTLPIRKYNSLSFKYENCYCFVNKYNRADVRCIDPNNALFKIVEDKPSVWYFSVMNSSGLEDDFISRNICGREFRPLSVNNYTNALKPRYDGKLLTPNDNRVKSYLKKYGSYPVIEIPCYTTSSDYESGEESLVCSKTAPAEIVYLKDYSHTLPTYIGNLNEVYSKLEKEHFNNLREKNKKTMCSQCSRQVVTRFLSNNLSTVLALTLCSREASSEESSREVDYYGEKIPGFTMECNSKLCSVNGEKGVCMNGFCVTKDLDVKKEIVGFGMCGGVCSAINSDYSNPTKIVNTIEHMEGLEHPLIKAAGLFRELEKKHKKYYNAEHNTCVDGARPVYARYYLRNTASNSNSVNFPYGFAVSIPVCYCNVAEEEPCSNQ